MDLFIFIVGLFGFIGSVITLIKKAIKKEPKKKTGIIIGICLVLMVVGLSMPSSESKNKDDVKSTVKEEINAEDEEDKEDENEEAEKNEPIEESQTATINAGNYKVGEDIPEGEYIIFADGVMGYYELSKDSSGSLDSIITNDNFTTFVYLTISEGQYLKLQMAYATPVEEMAPYAGNGYGPGMYKVGYDIPAGEYNVQKEEGQLYGYVEVAKDSKGTLDSIITNDNFETNKYVTIKDGQYLKILNGYIE